MEVTGYQLREAVRRWTLRRDAIANQFDDSLYYFKGEGSIIPSPKRVVEEFLKAEETVAKLQSVQMQYNLGVKLTTKQLGSMTLAEAIKRIGGLGRVEKMWRSACSEKKDRYAASRELVRNKDEQRADRTISPEDALTLATKVSTIAGSLRAAIAEANSKKFEIQNIPPDLIED